MAAPDDPNVVRAVIERQIEYLGEQVSRIDGEHEEIRDKLEEVRRELTDASETLSALDLRIRTLLDDPPRLEQHWKFGQGVFLAQWSDAAARAVGHRVLTILFAAILSILAGLWTWVALRGGK